MSVLRTGNKDINSIMSKPKKEIERSKYNVSKITYNKNKDSFNYICPKTIIQYKDVDKDCI